MDCFAELSCATCTRSARMSIQGSGEHPTFPARWLYGLCRDLPGDEFLVDSVTAGQLSLVRQLDTCNGCQDHTVLPYAACPAFVGLWRRSSTRCVRSRAVKPALRSPHAPDAAASTATRPSFATMANAPLGGTGWGRCNGDLGAASREFL